MGMPFQPVAMGFSTPCSCFWLHHCRPCLDVAAEHSGSWPREDPAAAVLCILACCGLGAAWSVAVSPSPLSAASFATSIFWGAFVGKLSFLLVGVCTTSGVWWAVDKLLRIAPPPHATIEPAEWAYLFDVHCNASIAAVCGLSAHLVVLPVIAGGGVAGAVASNLLLGATVCAYWLVVMRGALALPFVGRGARALLYPAASAVLVLLVASLGGVDVWSLIAQLAAVQL